MQNNFYSKIETNTRILNAFKYKQTSSWIAVKNYLQMKNLDKNLRVKSTNTQSFFSFDSFKMIIYSMKHYLQALTIKKSKNIFLGASTGLFSYDKQVKDAYFPYYEVTPDDCIYMVNTGNLPNLMKYKSYFTHHLLIIENYLIAPLKKLISPFIFLMIDHNLFNTVTEKINKMSAKVFTEKEIRKVHSNFIAGVILYRFMFKHLKLKKAYIVSAYTKSDIVAALKSLNIEVIEIQHGIIGKNHIGYNYRAKNSILPTPDKIYVYNQFWKVDLLAGGYYNDKQIKIVGKLKYDLISNKVDNGKKYFVYTGQAFFSKELLSFFIEADSFLKEHGVILYYLPHPKENRVELSKLSEAINDLSNIKIYSGNATTEELIKYSLAHISLYSACHFDAIHFLNKTFILDIINNNYMEEYAEHFPSQFIKISKAEEIQNYVE